jgi:hypothetical protein
MTLDFQHLSRFFISKFICWDFPFASHALKIEMTLVTYIGDGLPDALQQHGRTSVAGEVGRFVPLDVNGGRDESCGLSK